MTSRPSPGMQVVKKEEKEARLRSFLQRRMEDRSPLDGVETLRIIARSFDSPAIRAICIEAARHDVHVDAIVLRHGETETEMARAFSAALAGRARCRMLSDTRLLDAHEQIIISDSAVWIGDCMRRDPMKRDAFECYVESRCDVADWSISCFDRLWQSARPIEVVTMPVAAPAVHAEAQTEPSAVGGPEPPPQESEIEVATRH